MSFEFEFSQGGSSVPAGAYKGKFHRVENREKNEHGNSIRLIWKITRGDHEGEEASRIVGIDRPPTAKNALGRILSGLAGKLFEPGDKINIEDYIGKVYVLDVRDAPGGNGTRVEACIQDLD